MHIIFHEEDLDVCKKKSIWISRHFRSILMRRVKAWRLENLELTGADCFVLDMLAVNIPHNIMDQVIIYPVQIFN